MAGLDLNVLSNAEDGELAEHGQCGDNVYWDFDKDTGELVISGTGEMYNYDNCNEGYYSFGISPFCKDSSIKRVVIDNGVTQIGTYIFQGCREMINIEIPDSVTSIGFDAFIGTGYYNKTINWDHDVLYINNYLIEAKSTLTGDYYTKESTKIIASCAFEHCTGLTSITIPDSVTSIGSYAFDGCTGLTNITIPDSITSIGSYAFRDCTGLTSVTIPDSVTSIGSSAFRDCTGLTSITIPDSVTHIGDSAFYSCTGFTSITIPDSVTSIGSSAFSGCTGLTNITIPDSVTSIGTHAFDYINNICYNGNASGYPWGD